MDLQKTLYTASTWVLPVLIAITFHEAAHAYAAWKLGDDTAYRQGRVTFNPLKHVDPFGTILVPALLLLTASPFLFGWARPVPVAFHRLSHPRRDMALVAIAGPLTNVALAVVSGALNEGEKIVRPRPEARIFTTWNVARVCRSEKHIRGHGCSALGTPGGTAIARQVLLRS